MPISYTVILSCVYLASGIFIFLLGLTILRTGGSSPTTRSTALILFFCGVGPVLSATNIILLGSLREGAVVYTSMLENFEYLWEFYFPSLFLFSLTFPRENRVIQKYGFLAVLLFVPHIVHLFTIILADNSSHFLSSLYEHVTSKAEFPGERGTSAFAGFSNMVSIMITLLVRAHRQLFSLVNIVFAMLAIMFLAKSTRQLLSPRVSRQLKTVLLGLVVSVATYAITRLAPIVMARRLPETVNLALINFSLIAGGGTIAYAVVRQEFLGIRFIIRKSILYAGASLVFALIYLTIVKPVSVFFGNFSVAGQEAFETGFIILSIIAFQPALTRVEELLERFLLRGKDDVRTMFKVLGNELRSAASIEELEERLKRGVESILNVPTMQLVFCSEGQQADFHVRLLAEVGDPVTTQDLIKLGKKAKERLQADRLAGGAQASAADQQAGGGTASAGPDANCSAELLDRYDVLVPIVKDKKCTGIVALARKSYGMRFSAEELALLSLLSREIGMAVENIRLLRESIDKQVLEEELKLARSIQLKLLPESFPVLAHYDLHAVTLPSRQVGGDFYDCTLLDDRTLVVVVADVSGKGIPASLLVATLHAALKSNEDVQRSPGEMMNRINRLLFQSTSAEQFATLFYGVVNLETGQLRFANAGHDFPIIVNGEGSRRLRESGMVLGCLEAFRYREHSWDIPEHGGLVLYTDGVTEASASDIFFGEDRLERLLIQHSRESAENLCRLVLDEVTGFAGDSDAQDDLTLLVLKRNQVSH
jgi:serine phosphatase RsbU (regulator of sigma subunit)